MSLSHECDKAISRALAGMLMFQDPVLNNLTQASKADNPASALQRLRLAQADLQSTMNRIEAAMETAGRDILSDDLRAQNDATLRELMDAMKPYSPRLVVVS